MALNYRLRNMLGGPESTVPGRRFIQNQAPPQEESGPSDYFSELQKIRGMKGPAETGYMDLLAHQPKMEDYTPNRWQRMGAIFSGFGTGLSGGNGSETAYNLNATPYREAQSQYSQRLGNSEKAAGMEVGEREDRVKDLMSARDFGLNYGEYKRKVFETENKAVNDSKNSDAALQRATAYAQSIEDKNWETSPQADGSVLLIHKTTGQRRKVDANTVEAYSAHSGRIGANASAISASASKQNADTNAGELELNQMNSGPRRALTGAQTNYYQAMADNGGKSKTAVPSPGQQAVAIANAADMLSKDPRYARFVGDPDDKGNRKIANDDGSPAYKIFMQALKKTVKKALEEGDPFNDDTMDGMDDVEDLGGTP